MQIKIEENFFLISFGHISLRPALTLFAYLWVNFFFWYYLCILSLGLSRWVHRLKPLAPAPPTEDRAAAFVPGVSGDHSRCQGSFSKWDRTFWGPPLCRAPISAAFLGSPPMPQGPDPTSIPNSCLWSFIRRGPRAVPTGLQDCTVFYFSLKDNYFNVVLVSAIHQYESTVSIHRTPPS